MKTVVPPAKGSGPVTAFAEEQGEDSASFAPYLGYAYAANSANSRTVIFVHGGAWTGGNFTAKEMEEATNANSGPCERIRNEGNFCFAINYPLAAAPADYVGHPYRRGVPFQSNIVEKAVAWCEAHATEYNGSATKIILVGGSSGGHIAGFAAEAINTKAKTERVKLCITLSGPMDLTKTIQSGEKLSGPTAACLGVKITEANEPIPKAIEEEWSPVDHVDSFTCPYVLFNGKEEQEVPVANSILMQERLEAKSITVSRLEAPSGHALAYWGSNTKGKLAGESEEKTLKTYQWVCRAIAKV